MNGKKPTLYHYLKKGSINKSENYRSVSLTLAGFLLSVVIAGTKNPKAGTTYHAQPVDESKRITDHCGYTRNLYIM